MLKISSPLPPSHPWAIARAQHKDEEFLPLPVFVTRATLQELDETQVFTLPKPKNPSA